MKTPKVIRRLMRRPPRVHVLRLSGAIGGAGRFARGLSDAALAESVERAFSGRPKAVAVALNSPGGSPVQSALIAARLRRLAEENEVPLIAFCEDVAASGGYWLACAADEILADETSIVGSIGVISASFGLHELIARNGIERRVHTAGRSKSMLDPFRPENPDDVARLKTLQEEIHQAFIAHVKARRGDRLDADADLFTGDVWTGRKAVELGLIDGIGHLAPVMRERFGKEVEFRDFSRPRGLLSRVTGGQGAAGLAGDAGAGALAAAEERALWARWGI